MPVTADEVGAKTLSILRKYSRKDDIALTDMIAKDLGIVGDAGVDILYDLEEAFAVDLTLLVEEHAKPMSPRFIDRLLGRVEGPMNADVTVAELLAYIKSKLGVG